jgi:hypothetical protein
MMMTEFYLFFALHFFSDEEGESNSEAPILEFRTTLSSLATLTKRFMLGRYLNGIPSITAKMLPTLDA